MRSLASTLAKGASAFAIATVLLDAQAHAASNQPLLPLDMTAVTKSSSFYKTDTPPADIYRYAPRAFFGAAAWGSPGLQFFPQIAAPLTDLSGLTMECPQCGGYQTGAATVIGSPNAITGTMHWARTQDGHSGSTVPEINVVMVDRPSSFGFSFYTEAHFQGISGFNTYQPTGSGYTPLPPTQTVNGQPIYASPYQYVRLTDQTNPLVTGLLGDVYVNATGQVYNVRVTTVGNVTLGAALPFPGDVLVPNSADMGNTGSGATWTVANVQYRKDPTSGVILPNAFAENGEVDTSNMGPKSWVDPLQGNLAGANGFVFACESRGGVDCTYAAAIGSNIDDGYTRHFFQQGFIFGFSGLAGADGQSPGYRGDAIEFSSGDQERWIGRALAGTAGQVDAPVWTFTAEPNPTGRSLMNGKVIADPNGLGGHYYIGGAPGGIGILSLLGAVNPVTKVSDGAVASGMGIYTVNGGTCTTQPTVNGIWSNTILGFVTINDPGKCSILPTNPATLNASGGATVNLTPAGSPGSGLTDGTYSTINLFDTSGRPNTPNGGQQGSATFVVSGGVATSVTRSASGFSYLVNDQLSPRLCTATLASNCITVPFTAVVTGSIDSITFTSGLVAATSGTLTSAWADVTRTAKITFSDGSVRMGSFTNGSTAVTWTGGSVTASAAAGAAPGGYSVFTVTAVASGALTNGALISGSDTVTNIPPGDTIVFPQIDGTPGGVGHYKISGSPVRAINSMTVDATTAVAPVVVVETNFDSTPVIDIYNVVNDIDSTGTTGNYLQFKNAVQGASPSLNAIGQNDADVSIAINPLRNGKILLNGIIAPAVAALAGTGSRPVCITAAGLMEAGTLSAGAVTCP